MNIKKNQYLKKYCLDQEKNKNKFNKNKNICYNQLARKIDIKKNIFFT